MALEVQAALEAAFQEVDAANERFDEFAVRDRLARMMLNLGEPTPAQRKGNLALVGALDFQGRRNHAAPVWEMHWQPLSTAIDAAGKPFHSPDVTLVDDEILEEWVKRAGAARHPLLRARYADLAWEVARFRRKELACRPDVSMARIAIDGYLEAIERDLAPDEFITWNYIERALELAASINDASRVSRAKAILFRFGAECEARDPTYAFWRFDDVAWSQAQTLELSSEDRALIVGALERQLAVRSNVAEPQLFDPHFARTAADRLGRWREFSGEKAEARRTAQTAGAAFEAAASKASALVAIAWLSEQALRYRQLGDGEAVARVEQAIRERANEAQGLMRRISVPLKVTPEEVQAWADKVAGNNLEEGLRGFAAAGLIGRNSTERAVLDIAAKSPLIARIPISITGPEGFTKATIGSIDDDLDGRTVHHAAQLMSQRPPFLNAAWERLREKHSVDLERLIEWISQCPFFPPSRLRFLREGMQAWFAGDMVKVIHVLVPQVEAALRDVLAALGGAVTRPDPDTGGFQMISLGDVLSHERFKSKVHEDIRFHLKVLYQDPRGLNIRNEVAHGIASFELFGLGLANTVVHSVILIGTFRVERKGESGAPANTEDTPPKSPGI